MIGFNMKSLHENILDLTEKIEKQLGADLDLDTLLVLLIERRQIFNKLLASPLSEESEVIIKKILASEKRCVALAMDKKKQLQTDLQEARNRKRLHQAYGKTMALG